MSGVICSRTDTSCPMPLKCSMHGCQAIPAPPQSNNEAWLNVVEDTFTKVKALGASKGAEYSGDTDRLANFRRNGADLGMPMETIWRVYAAKHWDSLGQYVQDLTKGRTRKRSEPLEGRVDDLITYLCLFKLMLRERGQE